MSKQYSLDDDLFNSYVVIEMVKAVYPGSFDPPTFGHLNIIERASLLFDELTVVVANNRQKQGFFSAAERYSFMQELTASIPHVKVALWDGLIVDFANTQDAKVIVRGVRAVNDFGYEFELSMINKGLDNQIETLFMPTDPKYFVLRSSSIKELVQLGGDVSAMIPLIVEKAMKQRLQAT